MSILSEEEMINIVTLELVSHKGKATNMQLCKSIAKAQDHHTAKEIFDFLDGANDLKDLDNRLKELKARFMK